MSRRDELAKGIQQTTEPMADQKQVYPTKPPPDIPARAERISPEALQQLRDQAARALKRTDDGIELLGCSGNAAGLFVPDDITPEVMESLSDALFGFEGRIQLYIGDMLVSQEKLEYGSHEAVAAKYQREVQTLYRWKSVCKAVPIFRRRKVLELFPDFPLSMKHYEIVQKLEGAEQEMWLLAAAREKWSTAKLNRELNPRPALPEPSALKDNSVRRKTETVMVLAAEERYSEISRDDIAEIRQWLALVESMIPKTSKK